MVIEGQSF